jgi:hypothetical protein
MENDTQMQSISKQLRHTDDLMHSRTHCVHKAEDFAPGLSIFRGSHTFFSTAASIASRHVPRLAFAAMVMCAHHHASHAATPGQTGAVNHARHRSPSHRAPRRSATIATIGDKVVAYVSTLQGRQVGDGECFDLADTALTANGLRSAAAYGEITPDADYVWGRPISLSQVQPGDVLQFRNFHIVKRMTTTMQGPGGQLSRSESEEEEERDHHTAIVERNFGDSISIYEQNVEPAGRVVQRNRIAIASHTENETNEAEASQTFTQISVEGEVYAYRPVRATRAEMAQLAGAQTGDGSASR